MYTLIFILYGLSCACLSVFAYSVPKLGTRNRVSDPRIRNIYNGSQIIGFISIISIGIIMNVFSFPQKAFLASIGVLYLIIYIPMSLSDSKIPKDIIVGLLLPPLILYILIAKFPLGYPLAGLIGVTVGYLFVRYLWYRFEKSEDAVRILGKKYKQQS